MEGYYVSLSSDYGNTWSNEVQVSGTAEFDLSSFSGLSSTAGITYANAVKIRDDGGVDAQPPFTGADIQSVEALNTRSSIFVHTVEFLDDQPMQIDGTLNTAIPTPHYDRNSRYQAPALGLDWSATVSQPAAYKLNEQPKLRLVFFCPSPISSATVSGSLTGFGTFSSTAISFSGNQSSPIDVTMSGSVSQVDAITASLNITANGDALPATQHRLYVVLDAPTAPFTTMVPTRLWSRALEFGCEIGRGATTGDALVTKLTQGLYDSEWRTKNLCYVASRSSEFIYEPVSHGYIDITDADYAVIPTTDGTPNWEHKYHFTSNLNALSTAGNDGMQCNEIAGWIQMQARMQGHKNFGLRIADFTRRHATVTPYSLLKTHLAYPAGSTTRDSYEFTFHEVATQNENPAKESITNGGASGPRDYAFYYLNFVHDAAMSPTSHVTAQHNGVTLRSNYIPPVFDVVANSRDSVFRLHLTTITEVD